jgi:hypothetical protein
VAEPEWRSDVENDSTGDEPIPEELPEALRESLARSVAKGSRIAASIYGQTMESGVVLLQVTGDNGVTVPVRLTEKAIGQWRDYLAALWVQAKRANRRNRGDNLWIAIPDTAHPGRYTVRHDGKARSFCSTIVRRKRRCVTCNNYSPPGATMYREHEPKSYAYPNWRNVRICMTCIARPVPLDAP